MGKFYDLTGMSVGQLTVISHVGYNAHRKSLWKCRCNCGLETIIVGGNLVSGNSKSCGCESRKKSRDRAIARNYKHGHAVASLSPEYRAFAGMHARCKYPSVSSYPDYGGRGIKVCKRWSGFKNFLKDMGLKPSPNYTLERKNPNGDYKPSNCRWATKEEQQWNRRNTRWVQFEGQKVAMVILCKRFNISDDVVRGRLDDGWNIERALTERVRKMTRPNRDGK